MIVFLSSIRGAAVHTGKRGQTRERVRNRNHLISLRLRREEKCMKRIVSCLLVFILIFSLYVDTYAEPVAAGTENAGLGGDAKDEEGVDVQDIRREEENDGADKSEGENGRGADPEKDQGTDQEEDHESDRKEGQEPDQKENQVPDHDKESDEGDELDSYRESADKKRISEENLKGENSEGENLKEENPEEENPEEEKKSSVGNLGQVDVEIISTLDLPGMVDFTVSLTGQEPKHAVLDADLPGLDGGNGGVPHADVTFGQLETGTYVLTVAAPGFAVYSQEIMVDGWGYDVTLTTGMVGGFDLTQPHPGFLLWGDVDRNSMIDDVDRDMLVAAIDAGEREPEKKAVDQSGNPNLDLNGNGVIDLADLECFAKAYGFSGDSSSSIVRKVPADAVSIRPVEGTKVTGDLNAMLKNEESVTLQTLSGAPISGEAPVSVEFDFSGDEGIPVEGIVIGTGNDSVSSAEIEVGYIENGIAGTVKIPVMQGIHFLLNDSDVQVSQDANGVITIDFGRQIAVKKVTLKITGMMNNNNLVEISKVEFLNDMESRIPEPQMDIPQNLSARAGNKQFTLTWDPCVNVTGYEVQITSDAAGEGKSENVLVKGNTVQITSFLKEKLVNGTIYTAKVQSVNGAWKSGYCNPVEVIPKADKKPDAPDNLKLTGAYKAIDASWKNMEDTDSYNLYYREKGADAFSKIEAVSSNKYTITGLKDKTGYEVYVTGVNELGEGKPSLTGTAETTSPEPAHMPKYKLINRAADGEVSKSIINASFTRGAMQDSGLDAEGSKTAWGTVDNNQLSHFLLNSWDSGGYNPLGVNGLTYEFDQAYKLRDIALQEVTVQSPGYGYAQVRYWDENGNAVLIPNRISVLQKKDSENRIYYLIRLPEAVTAKKIQFGLARSVASGTVTCSEVYFYHYDTLEDEIMALYTDDLHTELRSDVTQKTIDDLRERINTPDEVSGEYNPDREKLERELKTAEDILNAEKLGRTVKVHNSITTQDVNRGFGGLNAWQPLGVTAAAGEEITVYVGHNQKRTGDSTNLQLIATQYHSEAASMSAQAVNLKVGRNDITIPKLSTIQAEAGGALYVQYTGNNGADQYAVRVSGGAEVPILDLHGITERSEQVRLAQAYVTELQEYVSRMEAQHEKLHKGSKLSSVQYDYNSSECILGASDIMLDTMMLSLPASQILAGSGSSAERLVTSAEAMEKMLHLFYQHKGLTENAADENGSAIDVKNTYPSRHLNIRYQRMFAGAFMYASGNHIGIEWGSAPGMVSGAPVVADENGKYVSGNYFGWGIAHEIGHCINQGSYAIAEITNNYFSVLAQAKDTNDSVRFKYGEVYKKVTSGTKGRSSNVFTQLGMYWQLHLAYDNGYNFKTYDNYNEQLRSLFFARVDTYARDPSGAPAPGGIKLELPGDQDQNLMRLACAAAEKNLLEFFERWGMRPNEGTVAYAGQFAPETRAIYYVNDDSRVYRLEHTGSSIDAAGTTEAVGNISAQISANAANQVDFQLEATIPADDILGYEIVRRTTSGGEVQEEVVGFTTGNRFSDTVTTTNNRVVTYKVTVIDKYLNRSAPKLTRELKIEHDGSIDKGSWTISANDLEATSEEAGDETNKDVEDSCGPAVKSPVKNAADGRTDTVYTGKAGANAEVILEFNRILTVTGFKYTPAKGKTPIRDYSIVVRDGDGRWKEAAGGTFDSQDVHSVYFGNGENDNITAYQATAVKLVIPNQAGTEIGIAELDVLGVTGDNVDFRRNGEDGKAVIGRLKEAFTYDSKGGTIPAGSLVFTGAYKGNPAYNVVILYDQDGNIVGGTDAEGALNASQIILADVPKQGMIEDVSDGSWVYWIEPEHMIDLTKLERVRAELYRVDDAVEDSGQRLVSDSLSEAVEAKSLAELPEIQLTSSQSGGKK